VSRPTLTLHGDRRCSALAVQIPPAAETPFLFRRAFLHSIRVAIGQAQIAGEIDAATCVELLHALPPASADEPT
jgi:hypothetical protein